MKAHELLSSSLRWGKGAYAVSLATGDEVPSLRIRGRAEELADTCTFCLEGAIMACYDKLGDHEEFIAAYEKVLKAVIARTKDRWASITAWNDLSRTRWEDVYSLLKELDI